MPYRLLQLGFYPAVTSVGIIGALVGVGVQAAIEGTPKTVVQYAATPTQPPYVTETGPIPPYGMYISLAATASAMFAVIGKSLMDFKFGWQQKTEDAAQLRYDRLNDSFMRLHDTVDKIRGELTTANSTIVSLRADNAHLMEQIAAVNRTTLHTDKHIVNQTILNNQLAERIVEPFVQEVKETRRQSKDNAREIEILKAATGSSDDITVKPKAPNTEGK